MTRFNAPPQLDVKALLELFRTKPNPPSNGEKLEREGIYLDQ